MTNLTVLEQLLLDTLTQSGQWMTRMEIAKAIGRPGRLSSYDRELLARLIEFDVIEQDVRSRGVVQTETIYRAKPKKA